MRRHHVFLILGLLGAFALPQRAETAPAPLLQVGASLDISFFYDELSPYGEWVEDPQYGYVWSPNGVDPDWRPYTLGHWVYSDDEGWVWVSDEPWGWGPFHYGRWFVSSGRWVWVPGSDWAPAWVSWRTGGGYIGWAALPPQAVFAAGVGLRIGGVEIDALIQPTSYCFVEEAHLADTRVVIVPPARNVTIVNVTKNVTTYNVVGNQVVNRAVSVATVEKASGHAVPRAKVVAAAASSGPHKTEVKGNEVQVYRPAIKPLAAGQKFVPPANAHKAPPKVEEKAAPKVEEKPAPKIEERGQPPRVEEKGPPPKVEEKTAPVSGGSKAEQDLALKHAKEKADLDKRHAQEVQHPPQGVSSDALKAKHDSEQKALEAKQEKERQQVSGKKPTPKPSEKPEHP
jgi:hypothetical protein